MLLVDDDHLWDIIL